MIHLENISLSLPGFLLRDVTLHIPQGQYAVLMGRTGCGKTTILELLCGLRKAQSGTIHLDGQDATRLRPAERRIGYVPQDRAIFTHLSVYENLAFALRMRRQSQPEVDTRVQELAKRMELTHLLQRRAEGLSGGECQRVALGRALASKPAILLLDEPLSALDEDTHDVMCELLIGMHRETGVTVLHVTHSRREASLVGQRLLRFSEGRIFEEEQLGRKSESLRQPGGVE